MSPIPQELDRSIVALVQSDRLKVPPYPAIALRLSTMIQGGEYSQTDLCKLVAADQALSAAVLRCANSARFRRNKPITTLTESVLRIGSTELVRLAFTFGLAQSACAPGPLFDLRREVWRQAVWSAVLCRELAPLWWIDAEPAFLCGLLHDFGRIIALSCLEEVAAASKSKELRLTMEECKEVVDRYHVELGMVMAEKWQLPALVADVIRDHHHVLGQRGRDLVELIRVSDEVIDIMESRLDVQADDLAGMTTLNEDERRMVVDIVPALPGLTEGFDPLAAVRMVPRNVTMMLSLDMDSQGRTDDVMYPVELTTICQVFGDDISCELAAVSLHRLEMMSPRALAAETILQLTLEGETGPFRMWCTVATCRQETESRSDRRHRMFLKPFGLTAISKMGWTRIVGAAAQGEIATAPVHIPLHLRVS